MVSHFIRRVFRLGYGTAAALCKKHVPNISIPYLGTQLKPNPKRTVDEGNPARLYVML